MLEELEVTDEGGLGVKTVVVIPLAVEARSDCFFAAEGGLEGVAVVDCLGLFVELLLLILVLLVLVLLLVILLLLLLLLVMLVLLFI